MKNIRYSFLVAGLTAISLNSCLLKTEVVIDPNYAGVASVANDATKAQLNDLSVGQIAVARNGLATYLQVVGVIGKEVLMVNSTESRWFTELNGLRAIDNSAFYNGATTAFGLPVRQANILINAATKSTDATVTEQNKNAYRGFANTFKGLAYLYMLNVQFSNGVRLDVTDPFNPSKAATYAESLAGIAKFLDEGATQLDGAGSTFPFSMPSTYAGFNTPTTFKQFNRAIALRVALYQKDWTKAAALLPQTFYSATGDLNVGPKHSFNATPPDVPNPMLNTSTVRVVGINKIITDGEVGDKRLTKFRELASPINYSAGGKTFSTRYITNLYTSNSDPVAIVRNEELVLAAAEIAVQQGNSANAIRAINTVRAAAGLPAYSGASTQAALINAILKERLYSLMYEGHRWVDMRRYDRLAQIELPVDGMKVLERLEKPVAEVNWDNRVIK